MKLVVSLHDVAPPFEPEIRRQITLLRSAGIDRLVLKVVPHWHGGYPLASAPTLLALLRDEVERGSQIVLHGLEHRRQGRLRGNVFGKVRAALFAGDAPEFLTLREEAAEAAVAAGLKMFEACALPAPSTFCPPAWLMTDEAESALRESGIRRTVSMFALRDLLSGARVPIAGIGYMGAGIRQEQGLAILNALVARTWVPRAPVTRVFLHPQNAPSPALDTTIERIGSLVTRGWQPVTFDDL